MSAVDAVNMSLDDIIAKTRGTKSLRGRGASRLGKAGRRGDVSFLVILINMLIFLLFIETRKTMEKRQVRCYLWTWTSY